MRVLLVSAEFPPAMGGIGTSALRLARGLLARADEVRVVTVDPEASNGVPAGSEP